MTEHYNLFVRGIDDFHDYTTIHKQRYDGILLMSQSEHDDVYSSCQETNIQIIVLNRRVESHEVMNILADDSQGAYKRRTISFSKFTNKSPSLEGKKAFKSTQERKAGFSKR
ncbi:hypothetical protein ACEQPO_24855 [Bacillus sp. SL00103]